VEREYSDAYAGLYRAHWWFRVREELLVETIRKYRPPAGWGAILDVGCGDGLLFDRLAEFGAVEGVEPDAVVVSTRFRDRIHTLPFDDQFRPGKLYSLVLLLDVLEHLPDPAAALRRALELLAPEGRVIITLPAFQILWTNHDVLNHHLRRYTRRSFRELAASCGLALDEERYLFPSLFPAKLAARAAERLLRLPPRVPSIPPAWLNRALYRYSRREQRLAMAVPFPFGISLLLVGRGTP
jgi:SAM-dependent methyltransferase